MSDYEDEDREPERRSPRPPAEGVRIIGAEEAAAALETGQVAGRRPDDAPRYGDVPPRPQGPKPEVRFPLPDSVDPTSAVPRRPRPEPPAPEPAHESPELPHWTDPPTGEVPRVLIGDREEEEGDPWAGLTRAPRWRDRGSDWEEADFDDVAALGGDDIRVGALDVNRTEHSDLFSFDEPEPELEPELAPEPEREPAAVGAPTRIHTRSTPRAHGAAPGGVSPPPARRDMRSAVGVGVALAVAALAMFKLGTATTLALATLVVTLSAAEAYAVFRRAGYQPATLLGLSATVSLMLAVYHEGVSAYPLVLALTVIFSFLWYLAEVVRARPTINVAVTLLGFLWVAVLGSFASLLLRAPDRRGIAFLLGAVLCTVAYDVGGLFFGSRIGRRPLMPAISPNKTVEGLAGGMLLSVVAGVFLGFVLHPWTTGDGLALGLVVAVVAPLGDLCQSMVKRDIGVKDMGSLLPGHGGVLDRFDALLFVLPAVYYLVQLLDLV